MNKKWLFIMGLAILVVPVVALSGCYAGEGQRALSALDINSQLPAVCHGDRLVSARFG